MSEESDMATCVDILEKARKFIPGRFGHLDETIENLKGKSSNQEQRDLLVKICIKRIDDSREPTFLKPIKLGLKEPIQFASRIVIDVGEYFLPSKNKAYNLMLCATYLFVELFAQREEVEKNQESNGGEENKDTYPEPSRSNSNTHFRQTHRQLTRHLELRMLVESTYLNPLESLQTTPDQPLNEEQIEAVFKRPNIHALHARAQAGRAGERSFVYDNGESFFVKTSQLYLCVNIELECKETSYQELLTTKSLSVMKRRLRGARFTLRELRYEKLNDTDRVITGKDD